MSGELVLASASPRRRELLLRLGVEFRVHASGVPEIPCAAEGAGEFVRRVAAEKARDVAAVQVGCWVLGADTVVAAGGEILGKPAGDDEARDMLTRLSGQGHQVLTGVALLAPSGGLAAHFVERSDVVFRELSEAEIAEYVAGGEPRDKAGAYAIQGGAGAFVKRISGSYSNIVGLPLEPVGVALRAAGFATRADADAEFAWAEGVA